VNIVGLIELSIVDVVSVGVADFVSFATKWFSSGFGVGIWSMKGNARCRIVVLWFGCHSDTLDNSKMSEVILSLRGGSDVSGKRRKASSMKINEQVRSRSEEDSCTYCASSRSGIATDRSALRRRVMCVSTSPTFFFVFGMGEFDLSSTGTNKLETARESFSSSSAIAKRSMTLSSCSSSRFASSSCVKPELIFFPLVFDNLPSGPMSMMSMQQ